jgi:hypothetical protein
MYLHSYLLEILGQRSSHFMPPQTFAHICAFKFHVACALLLSQDMTTALLIVESSASLYCICSSIVNYWMTKQFMQVQRSFNWSTMRYSIRFHPCVFIKHACFAFMDVWCNWFTTFIRIISLCIQWLTRLSNSSMILIRRWWHATILRTINRYASCAHARFHSHISATARFLIYV